MARVGIAIVTYNRPAHLRICLESVLRYCNFKAVHLSVFDDGSSYEVRDIVNDRCLTHRSKHNMGVVTSKNRALYYYSVVNPVETIIMLEDDTEVTSKTWIKDWYVATRNFGHMNYALPYFFDGGCHKYYSGGTGTTTDPFRFSLITGQCMTVQSRLVLTKVGYLNPKFKGFGYGHCEWSQRLVNTGFGGYKEKLDNHQLRYVYYSIRSGLRPLKSETFRDEQQVANNAEVMAIRDRLPPMVTEPWLNEDGKQSFLESICHKS